MPDARIRLVLLLPLLLVACGGGGGGGGATNLGPVVLSAYHTGAGADPVAGDTLILVLSETPAVSAGTEIDSTDLEVANGTLGTVAAFSAGARTLSLTLGAGTAMTVGTTTIQFAATNDAVRDAAGVAGAPAVARTLRKSDGDSPTVAAITLLDIPAALNGGGGAGGVLQVARNGFTIDLAYSDASSAIDTTALLIQCNGVVTVDGVAQAAGNNLVPFLTGTPGATTASFNVPGNVVFPAGPVVVTAYVVDTSGLLSAAAGFSFTTKDQSDATRLFETGTNASQVWFLDLSRDVESYGTNLGSGTLPVTITAGASGRGDFEDLLHLIGLQSATPIANVSGSSNSNEVALEQLRGRILARLGELFSGVNISFTFTAPGTFPSGSLTVPYSSLGFSQICVAGSADTTGVSGVLGLALFDEHNDSQDDDCTLDFSGSRLGVFLHTLVNNGFLSSPASAFRVTFDPFTPSRGGTPIGDQGDGQDGQRLLGAVTGARTTQIRAAIDDLGTFLAVIIAHETGHSMGLVKNGAMPTGLYGGDTTNFPGSSNGHIAIGVGGGLNVMTPSISYSGAVNPATRFNDLILAYLKELAIYD